MKLLCLVCLLGVFWVTEIQCSISYVVKDEETCNGFCLKDPCYELFAVNGTCPGELHCCKMHLMGK